MKKRKKSIDKGYQFARVTGMHFHARNTSLPTGPVPLMLAHFLPWYTLRGSDYPLPADEAASLDVVPHLEDRRHWNDARSGYRRTHLHMPEIGVYDSRDPAVMEWQIRTALAYGFNGFILCWYGKNSVENVITLHWLRGLEAWNRAHPEKPFCYFLCHDMQAQWPTEGKLPVTLEEDFVYIRDHLIRDAYVCRDGRPVFAVFPYGDQRERYRAVLDKVFGPGNADLIWSGAPRGSGEDGCFPWVIPDEETRQPQGHTWSDPDNCGTQALRRFYDAAHASPGLCSYVMHGVWPGFDDQLVSWAWNSKPDDPTIRPRVICRESHAGPALDRTWGEVIDYLQRRRAGDPRARLPAPLIQVVTWNDYAEASTVEPTRDYGHREMETCRRFITMARQLYAVS